MVTTERKRAIQPLKRRKWSRQEAPPGKRWMIGVATRNRNSIEVLAAQLGNKIDGSSVIEVDYARDRIGYLREDSKTVSELVEGLRSLNKEHRTALVGVSDKPIEMTRGIDIRLKKRSI